MVEEPPYVVLERLGDDVDIRKYSKQVWASTISREENDAYTKLASYISGGNREKKEIPMIAPVITRLAPEGVLMAFVMPKELSTKDLPEPLTKDITFKEIDEKRLAAISFNGYMSGEDYERSHRIVEEKLHARGIKAKGGPFLLQYDDPWTPPLERRNEIAYEL